MRYAFFSLALVLIMVGCDPTDPSSPNYDPDYEESECSCPPRAQFAGDNESDYLCWITSSGTLGCYAGGDNFTELGNDAPDGNGWVQVDTDGTGRACAIHEDHSLACWGFNVDYLLDVIPDPDGEYLQVALTSAYNLICLEHLDHSVECWGGSY